MALDFKHNVTERFLRSGAAVAIWDQDAGLSQKTAAELSAHGKVVAVSADVTSWPSIEAAAKETAAKLGGIDILVNNAGIAGPNAPVDAYPLDAWQQVIDAYLQLPAKKRELVGDLVRALSDNG